MKLGTPGFVGERLREAREARGISAISLADLLGVSRQAVSQFETGKVTPHPDTMSAIAEVLRLPVRFFCRPVVDEPQQVLFYRSLAATAKSDRLRSARRYEWLRTIVNWATEYVELPNVNFPELDVPEDPSQLTDEQIENLATEARRFWKLNDGPISNVVRLLERSGAIIARGALNEDIDAFSQWHEGTPYIFLGSEKESAARGRFNACHELGHLVLHRRVQDKVASRREYHSLMEKQAHRFAGAFLLPSAAFADELRASTLDGFRALKPRWVVSIATMIHRASDLAFIDEAQTTLLWKYRTRMQWRTKEPYDDDLPIEEPQILRRTFELIAEDVLSKTDIAAELPFSQQDIEELAGLPAGFLDDRPPVRLRRADALSNVVPFPSGRPSKG